MQESTLCSLIEAAPIIRALWEKRLRGRPIRSPMANPDCLIYLMEGTLNELFTRMRDEKNDSIAAGETIYHDNNIDAICDCGSNPLLGYFGSAREAVLTWARVMRPSTPEFSVEERKIRLHELLYALEAIAKREIKSFCSVCRRHSLNKPLAEEKNLSALPD
jgi:hypothetical protein